MKRLILILFIVFEAILSCAQVFNTDSLKKLLHNVKEDTTRIMLLSQLSWDLAHTNPDSAFELAQQGLKLAKQINYPKGELYCKISTGLCLWSIGDYSTAIKLVLPEAKNAELTNDVGLQVYVNAVLVNSYRDQGDYSEALKYAIKGNRLAPGFDNCRLCKINNAMIASIYLEKGQVDSAKFYLQQTLLYPPYPPYFGFDGWIYSVAGRTYTDLKKYDSAFQFYQVSIQMLRQENNLKDLAGAYNNTAALFITTGLKDSALFYARRSLVISQKNKFAKENLETGLLLSKVYEKVNTDSSLYYYKQAMIAKDSLYNQEKQRQILSYKFNEELRQQEVENVRKQYMIQVKIYILLGALLVLLAIGILLWRNNAHRKKAYALLQKQKAETDQQRKKAEQTLTDLKSTQAQLIQSEKMASLGELTAGIAHEIQNPLNFVNNFSEVNDELLKELKAEAEKGNLEEVKAIAKDIEFNSEKINHHGKRADAIVKGMLQHSRTSSGQKEPTDINALADEYLRLAYHGLRAKDNSFNAVIKTDFDASIDKVNIIPQDIGRVVLNLINNAFYAVDEKKRLSPDNYEPTVSVSTKKNNSKVEIKVSDNGNGIPQKVLDKIFQPFFTTKPTGQGTGLGLSLSYDIVKAHGGELDVITKEGQGSEFIISLSAY